MFKRFELSVYPNENNIAAPVPDINRIEQENYLPRDRTLTGIRSFFCSNLF